MTNFSINEYKSMFLEPLRIVEPISWIKHIPFAFFIIELLKPKIVVELGVHTGNSFSAFCQAVKNLNIKASCYGVDTFKGDPHAGVYDESVYIDINNHITENYGDFAQLMRMTFDEALEYFSDGSIDLLHIDGYHTYEAVKHDFESWLPKMSDRGVILLHDTQVRRDEFGAWKLWEEISRLYPSYEFKFGYGLGVLAVGKNVPDEIIKFIDEAREKIFIERLFLTLGSNIEFRTHIQRLEGEVAEVKKTVAQKDERVRELEANLEDRNQHIQKLEEEVREIEMENLRINPELNSIKSSVTWRTVMKWHSFVDKIMPPMTRRRRWYELGIIGLRTIVNEGWRSFWWKYKQHMKQNKIKQNYDWIQKNEPRKEELERMREECKNFEYRPKISIITPVWNTNEKWLRAAIESVLNQVYDNWELCITDGGSTMPHVKKILKEYAKKDKRIKVKFLPENKGIAGNSNEALKLATGEFVVLLDHDDELALFALYEVVKVLNESRDIDFIYSDEDKIDEKGNYVDPFFKPDFSIHLLRSMNYLIHVAVMRKELVEQVSGFNSDFDGAQDYDLFFRLLEKTNKVYHIRKILYHWRKSSSSGAQNPLAKPWIYEKGKLALQCHLVRLGIEGIANIGGGYGLYFVDYKIKDTPAVDIIIPTRKMSLFKKCLKSIRNNTTWKNYKIWAVINGNYDYEIVEIKDGTELDGFANPDTGLIGPPLPYNWSRMNNLAVSRTKAPYIIFLNDDIQIITDNWIENMLQYAQQKDVGGVGVMLLYPDNSIQHAGDFITENGTGDHCFNGMDSRSFEINGLAQVVREVSAVTGACMMVRRDVFEEVGGFDENLRNFDDYDFCLRLRESGYKLIYTPYSKLYHYESPTRPQILDNKMVRYLLGRHKSKRFDPFYRYEWINMYNRARQR